MNSLVKSLVHPLMEANQRGIALVPGGFKPPTLGHFYMINQVAKHTGVEKVIVLIGHKVRDGVTKEESKAIWDIYSKYLPSNIEIKIADNSSPISDISSIIKTNPDQFFYPVVGIRGEMDLGDLKRFDSMKGKYQNIQPIVIKSDETETRISGTNTRAALIGGEKDRFLQYLPSELSKDDQDKIWNILTKTPLDESYAEPSKFDYPKHIKSLTEYMLDKGMDIRPLPKVKFVDNDNENASDFFGKTAYYDPNNRVIVLYTMNRHPKDIMRSFAHEMIHHIQNNENRLNNIKTQNTNEDGDLPEIEREAYEKGNMTFRNWTDTLTEGIFKKSELTEAIDNKIVCDNCGWSWKIVDGGDDLFICHNTLPSGDICGHDNEPINENKPYKHKSGFDDKLGKDPFGLNQFAREISEDTLNEGRYDKITNDISSAIFNHWKQDYENEVDASRFDQTFETDDLSIDVDANIEFTPDTGKLVVNGGADADEGYIEVRFEVDPEKLPEFWEEISMNLKDLIRHEIEHLTHGEGPNEKPSKYMKNDQLIRDLVDAKTLPDAAYFKLEKEVDANLQGMYLRAKKEKRKFKDVIDTYLDSQNITPKQKEEILDIWRKRSRALSLPKF
jgi:phosphopantetheine adenylyltransferase